MVVIGPSPGKNPPLIMIIIISVMTVIKSYLKHACIKLLCYPLKVPEQAVRVRTGLSTVTVLLHLLPRTVTPVRFLIVNAQPEDSVQILRYMVVVLLHRSPLQSTSVRRIPSLKLANPKTVMAPPTRLVINSLLFISLTEELSRKAFRRELLVLKVNSRQLLLSHTNNRLSRSLSRQQELEVLTVILVQRGHIALFKVAAQVTPLHLFLPPSATSIPPFLSPSPVIGALAEDLVIVQTKLWLPTSSPEHLAGIHRRTRLCRVPAVKWWQITLKKLHLIDGVFRKSPNLFALSR